MMDKLKQRNSLLKVFCEEVQTISNEWLINSGNEEHKLYLEVEEKDDNVTVIFRIFTCDEFGVTVGLSKTLLTVKETHVVSEVCNTILTEVINHLVVLHTMGYGINPYVYRDLLSKDIKEGTTEHHTELRELFIKSALIGSMI